MAYQPIPTAQNYQPRQQRSAQASRIIVKPSFQHGGGGLLVQQPGTYTIYDPKGNQLEQVHTGRPGEGGNIKVPSHSIASGLPQGSYFTGPDGTRYDLSGGAGQRHEFEEGQSKPVLVSNKGATGGGGGSFGSPQSGVGFVGGTYQTAGGNNVVIPGGVDWGSLQFNPADWQQAMADARAAGDQAKIQYLQNIKDSQQPALDLVNTDVAGIQAGENALIPGVRQQGDQDTQTNVGRAGQIDTFNQSRLPGINKFNRSEVGQTNEFNAAQFENAVEASGVDYRKRINDVLDAYGTEATGKFEDPLLNSLMTATARSRGADIASSAGIGSTSAAGIKVQDTIDVNQRIAMADRAKGMIPGIAGQAQQLLQPPLEQAKTQYLTPTAVPLNTSNIAERMPITAGISAGATAQHIADTAQGYQAIPATTALSSNIGVQEFNSNGQFQRDLAVLNGQQGQATSAANAVQGGFNADKGDQVRAENFAAYQGGLDTASQNQAIGAGANLLGAVIGGVAANPGLVSGLFGNTAAGATPDAKPVPIGVDQGTLGGGFDIGSSGTVYAPGSSGVSIGGGDSSTIDPVDGQMSSGGGGATNYPFPTDSQSLDAGGYSGGADFGGGADISPSMERSQLAGPPGLSGGGVTGSGAGWSGADWSPPSDSGTGGFSPPSDTGSAGIGDAQFSRSATPLRVGGTEVSQAEYKDTMDAADAAFGGISGRPAQAISQPPAVDSAAAGQSIGKYVEGGPPLQSKPQLAGPYKDMTNSVKDTKTGGALIGSAVSLLTNWRGMSGPQKLAAAGSLGVQILQAKGVLSPVDAKAVSSASEAFSVIANGNALSSDKTAANGVLVSALAGRTFQGSVDRPTEIAGKPVVATTTTPKGRPGYRLADGSMVSRDALQATADANGALHAYQVLTSPAAENHKVAALKAIGVSDEAANNLISRVSAGDALAGLSLFQSHADWDDQTPLHHAATVMQTTGMIHGALSNALPSNYKNKANTGAVAFKSFGMNQGPSVNVGPLSVSPSGANLDFYGIPIPVVGYGGNSAGAQSGQSGIHASSQGVSASTGMDIGGAHVGVSAGVTPTGGIGVKPTIQVGSGSGAATGAQVGGNIGSIAGASIFGPVGGMVGSLVGSFAGSLLGNRLFGSGSSKDIRNGYRANLVNNGFAEKGKDGSVNIPLANGSSYNIGADGGTQYQNRDGSKRFSYEVDWTNPVAADSIPAAHLLAIATGLDPSMTKKDTFNRVAGQLTNAITSNAGSLQDSYGNAKAFLSSKSVSPQNLGMRVEALRASNKISEQEYGVYLDQINRMFGTKMQPRDKEQSRQSFLQMLGGQKSLSKADKAFMEGLANNDELSSNEKKTAKRLASLKTNAEGGLPTPDRYQNQYVDGQLLAA